MGLRGFRFLEPRSNTVDPHGPGEFQCPATSRVWPSPTTGAVWLQQTDISENGNWHSHHMQPCPSWAYQMFAMRRLQPVRFCRRGYPAGVLRPRTVTTSTGLSRIPQRCHPGGCFTLKPAGRAIPARRPLLPLEVGWLDGRYRAGCCRLFHRKHEGWHYPVANT